ncbi:hypothetical protein [Algoriella sp.]|uniref:hypothetical protein n=1 Tax=Algoriella sp. TaxID=1872434 RepID=UPI001B049DBE|nr:hypothetical protein [Algoriella sp.]MBO6213878.1 hypothetical protein [Algoriella sp.]
MPVYFGCESFSERKDLISCLNKNLNNDVQKEIEFFSNIADYLHIETAQSKLSFVINKEGDFSDISADGTNPIFNSVAMSSLILLQNKMNRAEVHIQPGKDEKNDPTNVHLNLPVRYEAVSKDNDFDKFPTFERVLFTLKTDDETIEVRIDKDFTIRTIGNNGNREYFLGSYSNLFEMASVDPYATAFENAFKTGLINVTKGKVDDKEYQIQIKNFFENDANANVSILVFREENGTWAEYYEYKTKKEFNQSKFAQLTYR